MAEPIPIDELWYMLDQADAAGDAAASADIMGLIQAQEQQQAAEPPIAPRPELPPGNALDVILEPAQAIAGGLAGTVAGGWKGIATALGGGSAEDFGQAVVETQQGFGQWGAPETQRGLEATETLTELMERGIDLARIPLAQLVGVVPYLLGQDDETVKSVMENVRDRGLGETMGDAVMEETGSPILAALTSVSPEAAGMMAPSTVLARRMAQTGTQMEPVKQTPLRQAGRAVRHPIESTQRFLEDRRTRHSEMAAAIREGRGDERIAGYTLDGTGRVVEDPELMALVNEGVRQGFDRGAMAAAQGGTRADKAAMREMMAIRRQGDRDKLYKQDNNPANVAGRVVANYVRYLRSLNRDAGRQLDRVAKDLKGQYLDDISGPVNTFLENLTDAGVEFKRTRKKGKTLITPDYTKSDFAGSPAAQNLITKVFEFMWDPGRGLTPDAYDLHRLKKFVDETVTYGKNAEGLDGKAEVFVKDLRRDVDGLLDETFDDYNRINTQYSDTIGVLNQLQDVAGKKTDISGEYADSNIGRLMRRLMSNAVSRERVSQAVRDITNMYENYDGVVESNPRLLMMFADELDGVFGPWADTSLYGELAKGLRQEGLEAARGKSAVQTAVDLGKPVLDATRGITRDNAYRVMERFLNYGE